MLESFNRKTVLKSARYRDPTNTLLLDEGIDEEEIDDIAPMDMDLDSDEE